MNKKYKKIPLILMGLSGVALLTSGFSTWVISVQATQTISNINFNVAQVEDKRLVAKLISADSTLNFDADSDGGAGIISKAGSDKPSLDFGCKVQIGLASKLDGDNRKSGDYTYGKGLAESLYNGFTINLKAVSNQEDAKKTAYNNAISSTSAGNPDVSNSLLGFNIFAERGETIEVTGLHTSTSSATVNTTKYDGTHNKLVVKEGAASDTLPYREFEFIFTFQWGSFFNYENPVKFNPGATGYESKTIQQAIDRLNNLYAADEVKFDVTITTKTFSVS